MKTTPFLDYLLNEVLASIDNLSVKAMFGGYCLYKDGIVFALVADDTLYFKGDDLNKEKYLRQGSEPFTYTTTKRTTTMAYWKVPPEVLEDPKSITPWIEEAVKAGKRAYKERTTKR